MLKNVLSFVKMTVRSAGSLVARAAEFACDAAFYVHGIAVDINCNVQRRRIEEAFETIKVSEGDVVLVKLNLDHLNATQRRLFIEQTRKLVTRKGFPPKVFVIPLTSGCEIVNLSGNDEGLLFDLKARGSHAQ